MNLITRLLTAVVGLAGVASTVLANPAYTDGDLLLGVRATADPGANQDYVINLGPASQFTDASAPFTVGGLGNVANDLAIFSDAGITDWFSRSDVFWGIVGTDLASDPANTLYATRPRVDVNTQTTAWTRRSFSSQSTTNSTFRAFISGFSLSTSNASSPKGTIQSTSAINSYASFTSGGTDFGFFTGIEGNFGAGTAGSVLDLYRLTPTTQNPVGQGVLFVGTFKFSDNGQLTFTPAPPIEPTFRFSAATYSVSETDTTVKVTVVRGGLTTGADSVQFDTSDGTAVAGTDYTAKNAVSVSFAAGETQKDVFVDITNVAGLQSSRTFNVALSNASAGRLISPKTAVVTITDSTPQNFGTISISQASYTVSPLDPQAAPNSFDIELERTGGTDGAVSVDFSVAQGGTLTSPTDFTFSPATIQFAAGEDTKVVTVQLASLSDAKLPGTIKFSIGNAQGGATIDGANSTTTVNVTSKDKGQPTLTLTTKSGKVTSGTFAIVGSIKDNSDIDRVEVKLNGGTAQLATLGALTNGSRSVNLSGLNLENGKNTILVTGYDTSGNPTKTTKLSVNYANNRPALAGNYNGLIKATGAASNENTGFVFVSVNSLGSFTGKVTLGTVVFPIKGLFDNAFNAHFNVTGDTTAAPETFSLAKGAGAAAVDYGTLNLVISAAKVTGFVKVASNTVANVTADHSFFDGKTPATTVDARYLVNGGNYTVFFPARGSQVGLTASQYPQGDGYANLKINGKGIVSLTGVLADGTKVSAAAPVSEQYEWPFFAKLYKSKGVISGVAKFDDSDADSDIKGTDVVWIRPQDGTSKFYSAGWAAGILTDLLGAKYAVPAAGTASVVPGLQAENANGNAKLEFSAGRLNPTPLGKDVNISSANKVTNAPASDSTFSLKLKPATGLISGKFKHSDGTTPAFSGAVFQKGANKGAFGFFLNVITPTSPTGESGGVSLTAKP